jgi:hypothetical protein
MSLVISDDKNFAGIERYSSLIIYLPKPAKLGTGPAEKDV